MRRCEKARAARDLGGLGAGASEYSLISWRQGDECTAEFWHRTEDAGWAKTRFRLEVQARFLHPG